MMIRHVYVCLGVAGPEDPPHATIIRQMPVKDRIKDKLKPKFELFCKTTYFSPSVDPFAEVFLVASYLLAKNSYSDTYF